MADPLPTTVLVTIPTGATAPWSETEPARLAEALDQLPTTDRYEVGEEIARGGMGVVHRCRDRLLGRDLAVKVLLPGMAGRPQLVRRFIEEAQVGGRLQHPGVVPVHELGRLPDGRLFFTMKLVQGRTLAQLLRKRTSPAENLPALLKVFEQICQTLAYAHSQGVIHRDLKPHNVMVGAFGEVQVMDWGLAKVLSEASGGRQPPVPAANRGLTPPAHQDDDIATQAGSVMGTLAYMPPEQARGETDRIDERVDVFGLGAVLCEILTGQPPYAARTFEEVRAQAVNADLADAHERLDRCGADLELVALCKGCLAVEPDGRPRDGRVVAEAVTAHLAGVAERLRRAEIDRAASEARARAERGKRRMTLALAIVVVAALLVGGGTWFWLREARRARVEQTAQAVNQPLGNARAAQKKADERTCQTLAQWREVEVLRAEALAAGEQAAQALAAGEADDAIRAELDALLPALRAEVEAATRNRRMLERLHDISFLANDALSDDDFDFYLTEAANEDRFLYSSRRSRAEYAEAFRAFGIDAAELPAEEAARAVEREPLRLALVEALTDWLRLNDPGPERQRLDALVRLVEDDPFRRRVWQTVREADRVQLVALAQEEATPKLPVPLLLLLADTLFDADQTTAAIDLLRRTQTAHPGEFWLSNKLGEYLMFTGSGTPVRVAEATRYFTAALVIRPGSQVARINLGDALIFLGAHDEALETYRLALADRPDLVFARTKLAIALAVAGYHDEALAESRQALASRPGSGWVQHSHGSVCSMLERHDEAARAYQAALARNRNIAGYHSSLGKVLTELGRHDDAVAAHREAVRIKPSGSTLAHLADALLQRNKPGDRAAAGAAGREGLRLQPWSSPAQLALANFHEVEGQRDLAIDRLRESARLAPHDAGAWWQLGVLLRRDHRPDEASYALREAIHRGPTLGPRRAAMLRDLGVVCAERNDRAGALRAYRDAIQAAPREPKTWVALGDLLRRGDERGAAEAYHEALYLQSDHVEARTRLVDLLDDQGRFDEAIAVCTEAPVGVERDFRLRRARLLLDHDQPREAIKIVAPLVARVADPDGEAWHLRGVALRRLGKLDEAISAFSRAVQAKPKPRWSFVQPSLDLGDALLERYAGEPSEDAARGHGYRAWALVESDQPFPAIEAYREAVRLDPEEVRYRASLGETLLKAHQPEAALRAFDEALKVAPSDLRARRGRGTALRQLGQFEEACKVLEAASKAAKDDKATTVALAGVLRDLGAFRDAADLYDRVGDEIRRDACRRLEDLAGRLPSVANNPDLPTEDVVPLAEAAALLDRPALAARLFAAGLTADPTDDRRLHDLAIEASARAGCGEADGKDRSERDRAALRREAFDRLRTALFAATLRLAREANPDQATALEVVGDLRRWQRIPGLASVREAEGLARLPEKERRRWQALWDEVAALLRLAELHHARNEITWEPDRP